MQWTHRQDEPEDASLEARKRIPLLCPEEDTLHEEGICKGDEEEEG